MKHFLTAHQIKQPRKGLIPEAPMFTEETLGAVGPDSLGAFFQSNLKGGEVPPILFPNNDATIFEEDIDLQRNNNFDPFDCVTASHLNSIYIIHQAKFKEVPPKKSRRYTAVKSGTIPGQGNSYSNVQNSIENDGLVDETDYPSISPTMTQAEFFQKITSDIDLKENFKQFYEVEGVTLPRQYDGITAIKSNMFGVLAYSPIIVSVDGRYDFDSNGYVKRPDYGDGSTQDSHAVLLLRCSDETQPYYTVLDSENPNGLVRFEPNYQFHFPKVLFLTKKKMKNLYRKVGQPAIGLYVSDAGGIVLYRDGKISSGVTVQGGSLFKAMGWTYDMAQQVTQWPYPVIGTFGVDPTLGGETLDDSLINE